MSAPPAVALCRKLARALSEYADDLEIQAEDDEGVLRQEEHLEEPVELVSGHRQKQILSLPELATEEGMKTGEVARAIDYDEPNVYMTLRGLATSGLVEKVPGISPTRWRLSTRYRPNASPYLRMAGLVLRGEWCTYGDISIAVRGDTAAARAVGRAAATLAQFPKPHRVLLEGGRIPEGWHTFDGKGPDECRRRLEKDGVTFGEGGRADPSRRVSWDQLVERAAAEN